MKEEFLRPGLLCEGNSDERYLSHLIHKQLLELLHESDRHVNVLGCEVSDVRTTRSADDVLTEARSLARDCQVLFVHCDWDAAEKAHAYVAALEAWRTEHKRAAQPVALVPVLMTESWMLADKGALEKVVPGLDLDGYPYGTPAEVEKHVGAAGKAKGEKLGPKQVWKQLLGADAHAVLQDDADRLVEYTDLDELDKVPSYRAWRKATEAALTPRYL
ncbi:hypothetical protein ADL27_62025 [Streptomyces sp. NRRL F-6602]|nr:hypothetical protein ADL27_62025 [Streptomyces sp. NRRL F-6602]